SSYDDLVTSLQQIIYMDWMQPEAIAESYYFEGAYHPFEVA
ncbi:MAG: hypothetical protein JWP88_353, partial [Flaviaesturariibacter sp.]|nr:hypothetical protein [Flaviaesturariibacter sp.]